MGLEKRLILRNGRAEYKHGEESWAASEREMDARRQPPAAGLVYY
jgi:hypothetical protein